jgi:hypothetical protein
MLYDKVIKSLISVKKAIKEKFGDDGLNMRGNHDYSSGPFGFDRIRYEIGRIAEAILHIPGDGLGADDYDELANKPAIDGTGLDKDSTAAGLGLETVADAGSNEDLDTTEKRTLVGAINEAAAAISDLDIKVEAIEGKGGYLKAHDFGTAEPSQQQLADYAVSQIPGITDPTEIWNGTHVKNLYVDPATITVDNPDGLIDGTIWALVNTPDTDPPVFEWIDDGPEGVGQATNKRYGLMKGVEDPGDGSRDGDVTVKNGKMMTIGFDKAASSTLADEEASAMLPSIGKTKNGSLFQTVRNNLKALFEGKVDKSGDTMTGGLNMGGHGIGSVGGLGDVSAIVAKDGSLLIKGQVELDADHGSPLYNIKNVKSPVDNMDAANKQYVDIQSANIDLTGQYYLTRPMSWPANTQVVFPGKVAGIRLTGAYNTGAAGADVTWIVGDDTMFPNAISDVMEYGGHMGACTNFLGRQFPVNCGINVLGSSAINCMNIVAMKTTSTKIVNFGHRDAYAAMDTTYNVWIKYTLV